MYLCLCSGGVMRGQIQGILYEGEKGNVGLGQKEDGGKICVWIVTDREIIRNLLALQEEQKGKVPWEKSYMEGDTLILNFPYEKRRRLTEFLPAGKSLEDFWIKILILCMSCNLPWPMLMLVLESKAVNIRQDGTLYIGYDLNYDSIHFDAVEADCVRVCGRWLQDGLTGRKKKQRKKRLPEEKLAEKKLNRGVYKTFLELYQDLYIRKVQKQTEGLWLPKDDRVFYILFGFGLILFLIALGTVIVFLITGETPLFQLFQEPLRQIGTVLLE